jgi:hypothetical protein
MFTPTAEPMDKPTFQAFAILAGTLARPEQEIPGELRYWQHEAKADADTMKAQHPTARVVVINDLNRVVYEPAA